jgi:hypothetical protein
MQIIMNLLQPVIGLSISHVPCYLRFIRLADSVILTFNCLRFMFLTTLILHRRNILVNCIAVFPRTILIESIYRMMRPCTSYVDTHSND